MQVKARVQHIEPLRIERDHGLNAVDRAAVDLDAAAAADKHHDGRAVQRSFVQQAAHDAGRGAFGEAAFHQPESLLAFDAKLADQPEELVRVGHL